MSYRIPRTLDNSIRCVGIPIDTIFVFVIIFGVFVLFEMGFTGIVVGIIAANIFARFRTRSVIRRIISSVIRRIIRFAYWYLPSEMNLIKRVQGHQRKMSMEKVL